ncbi:MAG: C40 family peptidase [Cryomorphaceae bacterium]|jgi:cell wall-associated NlpC family hydrolase|nr:C40 family peptidase [Cryomorphaceae bacterium]
MKIKDVFFFILFLVFAQELLAQTPTSQSQTKVPLPNDPQVDAIINYAKRFLGVPYRYGGTTPSGFDCSGFINYIFGNFGFDLVRTSYGLAELGTTVKLSEIRPGDLMFFKGSNVNSTSVGHVALVVEVSPEAIKFIHSANSGVRIDNFKTSEYYLKRYIKTKRLDYGTP